MYMHIHTLTCNDVCMYVCMYMHIHTTLTCMYVCMYVCICIYTLQLHVCMYVCMYAMYYIFTHYNTLTGHSSFNTCQPPLPLSLFL